MISAFLSSWPLFHDTYIAGWLIALLLSLVGVAVVARDQIFIGAAVSHASMLGIAVGMWLASWGESMACEWCGSDALLASCGGLFAILGALITSRSGTHATSETHEAVTGWVYVVSASAAILLLSQSPHGLEEVHRLLSSTIIGATNTDVAAFLLLNVVTLVLLAGFLPTIVLLLMDLEMAGAVGVPVSRWQRGIAIWLGLSVGLSMHVSGMLFTFGCLVLPALIAKNLCREVRHMFWVAPLVALGGSTLGFILANYEDFPPGQVVATLLGLGLAMAWLSKAIRRN